jgi:hypothetical protein
MSETYVEDIDTLLDGVEMAEFEERRRPPAIRTPSPRSSFTQRTSPSAASQGQVQAAARNLDAKIETLTNAVKALESRTNTVVAEQTRLGALVRKEITDRRKGTDGLRADLQQTKMLAVLLPLLTQETVDTTDDEGRSVKLVTQSQNQLASILPFFLLMTPSGTDAAKGPFGDSSMLLIFALLLSKR